VGVSTARRAEMFSKPQSNLSVVFDYGEGEKSNFRGSCVSSPKTHMANQSTENSPIYLERGEKIGGTKESVQIPAI
jgi:hypothetical protein